MSTNASLKTIQDGLVFYYDTNSIKSYAGEPTTNYQWNGGSEVSPWTVGGTNIDVTGTADQGPIKGAKTWKFVKTGTSNQWNGWESNYSGIWTGNSGDVWTTSYWYKTTAPAGITNFGVGSFFLPDWSRAYSGTILANVSSVIADGDWHYNYTTTQINENYSNAIIVDGPSWGYSTAAGTLFINGLQWEKKSHPTPFSYGARSVTQGLLDLTKRNTINLSNATFNSNASITFNGSTSYIDTGYILNSSAYTKFVWFNTNNLSATNNIISGGSGGEHAFWLGGGNRLYSGHNGSWYIVQSSTLISANTWYFGAVSFNTTSGWKLYLNGALEATNAATTTFNGTTMPTLIGSYAYGNFYSGTIDMVGIYNRVLSDDEVFQLYNRTKSRYRL